ncbi:MAG: hypothetical protein ACTS6J_09735 [Burkholderiales bacterium]
MQTLYLICAPREDCALVYLPLAGNFVVVERRPDTLRGKFPNAPTSLAGR